MKILGLLFFSKDFIARVIRRPPKVDKKLYLRSVCKIKILEKIYRTGLDFVNLVLLFEVFCV